jgi:hypothetical protein
VCHDIWECLAIVNACLEKQAHRFTMCQMFVWSIWAVSGFTLCQRASPFHFFCPSSPFEDLFKKSYPFVMITPHMSSFPWFTSYASRLCSVRAFTSCNVSNFWSFPNLGFQQIAQKSYWLSPSAVIHHFPR